MKRKPVRPDFEGMAAEFDRHCNRTAPKGVRYRTVLVGDILINRRPSSVVANLLAKSQPKKIAMEFSRPVRCVATTKTGRTCRRRSKTAMNTCWQHGRCTMKGETIKWGRYCTPSTQEMRVIAGGAKP